ncbi:hypothetical protein F511_33797 [Dorcoceras hygrometricum]|uniref:Dystroglycan-like n=1 Tax=Dorcoceras hygrometricum TaxID=472368 RepID=A0A2Z7AQA9_9LAMI|nr:hypothetical protein F511_33797 [Dorcoceras hygrometricum]
MASSFYSNSQHVDFDSVLAMDDQGMVSMFQGLMDSGLTGFLGCPAVIYEDALVDFFENVSVRDGVIISTVAGQLVEISEEWFAESFDLPVDGLGDLSAIPKDVIFDARSIVSLSGEPVSLSGGKNQMKIEFCLLYDIMAKAISVKAGSFNAVTVEKFSLMTTIVCGVQINWARILFSTFKKMVTPGTKQAKGFAVQISLLLENIPNLDLGESSEFPASKILTDKTMHRFVSLNDKAGAEEATGAPKPKAASKKRPAADVEVAVAKKKRTIKTKSITSLSTLKIVAVAQEIVPLQMVEPCPDVPAIEEHVKLPAAEEGISAAQSVEVSIGKVDTEIDASADRDKPADTIEERHWFDLTHEELITKWAAERIITSPADTDEEIGDDKPFFKSVEAVESVVEVEEAAADKDFLVVDDPDTVINQWVKIPRQISSCEVHRQRQYDDTHPSVSDFFRVMKKRWADVCLEVTDFCASKRLLPVGSLQFCRPFYLADVRKEVQEVNAKVDILASRLNDVQKNVEETKEALCHQLLEFQSQSQVNQNILNAQLSELVNYINRGGADKKGESSSRGPQQPDAQISASAERTPSLAQRIEMAQRRIVQTVLDADSNRESLERQAAAERDRERRRREARSLKRRRS